MKVLDHYISKDQRGFYATMVTKDGKRETQRFTSQEEAKNVLHVWMEAERSE